MIESLETTIAIILVLPQWISSTNPKSITKFAAETIQLKELKLPASAYLQQLFNFTQELRVIPQIDIRDIDYTGAAQYNQFATAILHMSCVTHVTKFPEFVI